VQPPAIEAKESGQWKWKGKDEPSVKSWKRHEKTAGGEKTTNKFQKMSKAFKRALLLDANRMQNSCSVQPRPLSTASCPIFS
jgi:hypothetical protein